MYVCKNRITNEIYSLYVQVAYHVASHLYCLVLYKLCLYVGPIVVCESNSVELQINVFIISIE